MKDLPKFRAKKYDEVHGYIANALLNPRANDKTQLVDLITYPDHHYRAIFKGSYFVLAEGQTEPTKSQWNSLKKHLKRINQQVFVYKDHGRADCEGEVPCYYLDFGFFVSHT